MLPDYQRVNVYKKRTCSHGPVEIVDSPSCKMVDLSNINHHFPMVSHSFPIKNGDFPVRCVNVYQRVNSNVLRFKSPIFTIFDGQIHPFRGEIRILDVDIAMFHCFLVKSRFLDEHLNFSPFFQGEIASFHGFHPRFFLTSPSRHARLLGRQQLRLRRRQRACRRLRDCLPRAAEAGQGGVRWRVYSTYIYIYIYLYI